MKISEHIPFIMHSHIMHYKLLFCSSILSVLSWIFATLLSQICRTFQWLTNMNSCRIFQTIPLPNINCLISIISFRKMAHLFSQYHLNIDLMFLFGNPNMKPHIKLIIPYTYKILYYLFLSVCI